MFTTEGSYAPFTAVDVVRVAARSTAVHISLLAAAVLPSICRYWLPEYYRECAVTLCHAYGHSADNLLSSHGALHIHIYARTVYHNAVAIVPTWYSHAVRMLLYADVEISFLAACVLFHGVFLLPEYRHLLSNATIFYLAVYFSFTAGRCAMYIMHSRIPRMKFDPEIGA